MKPLIVIGETYLTSTEQMFSLAGSVILIFLTGIGFGRWLEAKRRRVDDELLFSRRVHELLKAVSIKDLQIEPRIAGHGERITVHLTIRNTASFPFEVWVGASIKDSADCYTHDARQDKIFSLEPGTHPYVRYLNVPPETQKGHGIFISQVWLGKCGHGDESIPIAIGEPSPITII